MQLNNEKAKFCLEHINICFW